MIDPESVRSALVQGLLYYLPDETSILNGRDVKGRALKIDGLVLPGKGTFAKAFTALQHNIDVTVTDKQLVISENDKTLTFTTATIDVFWLKIHAESYGAISATGPIYHTLLHIVSAPYDFYLQLPGARPAQYLVTHPHGLAINDVTNAGSFAEYPDEYALNDAINQFGYGKLVAGTGLEFLDTTVTQSIRE